MCQCMVCDCWWCNFCGVCCAGWAEMMCCCSCWCCKPDDLQQFDKECCHCCDGCAGYGGNMFCQGGICCSPDYLKKWSVFRTTQALGNGPMPNRAEVQQGGYVPDNQVNMNRGGYNQGGYHQGGHPPQYGGQPGGPTRIVINH